MARAHGLGAEVTVDLDGERVAGLFSGLDDAGALILRLDDGRQRVVMAGDYLGLAGSQNAPPVPDAADQAKLRR